MVEAHELAVRGEAVHRLLLEDAAIIREVVENLRLEDHKSAVDDGTVLPLLLAEGPDLVVFVDVEDALLLCEGNGRDGRDLPMCMMEVYERLEVHVRNAIAIGEHKRLIPDIILHALDASAGHGVEAGVDDGHAPRLVHVVMDLHLVVAEVEGDVRIMQEVVREILLDDVLLVAGQNDEIVVAVARVVLHDVPENRHLADFDHRLRTEMRLLGNTGSETTC